MATTKAQAGRLGGLATLTKHGPGHMAKIGRLGAKALWTRYTLQPYGVSGWVLVDRENNQVKSIWKGQGNYGKS